MDRDSNVCVKHLSLTANFFNNYIYIYRNMVIRIFSVLGQVLIVLQCSRGTIIIILLLLFYYKNVFKNIFTIIVDRIVEILIDSSKDREWHARKHNAACVTHSTRWAITGLESPPPLQKKWNSVNFFSKSTIISCYKPHIQCSKKVSAPFSISYFAYLSHLNF